MIGRTFLMPPAEDGTRTRAKIIERIKEHQKDLHKSDEHIQFRCRVGDKWEEIVTYNEIVDFIEADATWDGLWQFEEILAHKGPLKRTDPDYRGAKYNVQIRWMTGEITWEPLTTADKTGVYDTDPVTVAIYASKNRLLDTQGWKLPGLRTRAKTQQ